MTGSLELATRDEAVQQDTKRDGDGDAQPPHQNPESAPEGTEEAPVQNGNDTAGSDPAKVWITGWRLYCLIFGLLLAMFLSALETTIVSTSLISITDSLNGFDQRNWVVTSYLLTFSGFLVIFAKFSDVLGRKVMILFAIAIFTIFSIVCGSISSMTQLIVFRAFQGLGASGISSLVSVICPELVPTDKWGTIIAAMSVVLVLSSSIGPVFGGLISDGGSWRWVFLLNAPAGVISSALIVFLLPVNFPHHGTTTERVRFNFRTIITRQNVKRLDLLGATLLIGSSILLVFAFEEAGNRFPWDSPAIISSLVIAATLFVAFIVCEYFVGKPKFTQEPVFPLRLLNKRAFVGLLLIGFFTGLPFMTAIVNLPQRFQAVYGYSPLKAGINVLPFVLSMPIGTAVAGQLVTRFYVPPFLTMVHGASMQMLGLGLCSSVGIDHAQRLLGFQAILGWGIGMTVCTILIYIPFVSERKDLAVSIGVFTQIRTLGGTIGVAISAAVLNNHLLSSLSKYLEPTEVASILESVRFVDTLSSETRQAVQVAFNDAFNEQLRTMLYFSAVVVVSVALLWEWPLRNGKQIKNF